ncbi:MAG: insulinase family protein [Clostridia bacterium]|nr:insulinase family protein [Clostridia bacterium]
MAKEIKLKCGTTIVAEQIEQVRSVAFGIWVSSGSVFEDDFNNGVSHFIEHMMFKGTDKRNARQIAEDMDRIGASFNAFTGKEATCYYFRTISSNLYAGAEILFDMLINSRFDTEEMDKERKVVLEEIKMVKDTPDDDVQDTISSIVNNYNPLHRTILGSPESLERIDREVMLDYYRKRYARDGIVIAIAGNFDEDELVRFCEDKMGALNEKLPETERIITPYERKFSVRKKDIEQTHICLATPTVSSNDDMYYTFALMNNIFGGSMSSRLFQNIREQKGLAYSVCSMSTCNSFSGYFNIYAGVAHDKIEETIKEIGIELDKLALDGVTDDELSMAMTQAETAFIFSLENTATLMFSLGRYKLLMNRLFSVDEAIEKYNSITRADILKAADMISDFSNYCCAAVTGVEFDPEEYIG